MPVSLFITSSGNKQRINYDKTLALLMNIFTSRSEYISFVPNLKYSRFFMPKILEKGKVKTLWQESFEKNKDFKKRSKS